MAGKGDGEGEGNIMKLQDQITVVKYVLIFFNVLQWVRFLFSLLSTITVVRLTNYGRLFYIQVDCKYLEKLYAYRPLLKCVEKIIISYITYRYHQVGK